MRATKDGGMDSYRRDPRCRHYLEEIHLGSTMPAANSSSLLCLIAPHEPSTKIDEILGTVGKQPHGEEGSEEIDLSMTRDSVEMVITVAKASKFVY